MTILGNANYIFIADLIVKGIKVLNMNCYVSTFSTKWRCKIKTTSISKITKLQALQQKKLETA